jgi:hypothetical protein
VDVQEIKKLESYFKGLFGNPRLRVVPRPKKIDSAEVYIGEDFIGVLSVDDEDDERSYDFNMAMDVATPTTGIDAQAIKKLDNHLKGLFGNPRLRVVARTKKTDSAEVYIGEDFVGVLFVGDEDDKRSCNFNMAILGADLQS